MEYHVGVLYVVLPERLHLFKADVQFIYLFISARKMQKQQGLPFTVAQSVHC